MLSRRSDFGVWRLWREKLASRRGLRSFTTSFGALSWLKRGVLVLACLLAVGLFAERYGENIVKYHNPVPACYPIIGEDECSQFGPYARNEVYVHTLGGPA